MPARARAAINTSIDGASPQRMVPEPRGRIAYHEDTVADTKDSQAHQIATTRAASRLYVLLYPKDDLKKSCVATMGIDLPEV